MLQDPHNQVCFGEQAIGKEQTRPSLRNPRYAWMPALVTRLVPFLVIQRCPECGRRTPPSDRTSPEYTAKSKVCKISAGRTSSLLLPALDEAYLLREKATTNCTYTDTNSTKNDEINRGFNTNTLFLFLGTVGVVGLGLLALGGQVVAHSFRDAAVGILILEEEYYWYFVGKTGD